MKKIPFSECEICKSLPSFQWCDYLFEKELPAGVYKLDSIDDIPGDSVDRYVKSPSGVVFLLPPN